MKETDISSQVDQILKQFESMKVMEPSANWKKSINEKLLISKPVASTTLSMKSFAALMLLLFILNFSFVLKALRHDSQTTSIHNKELRVISEELLINPNSIQY